MDLCTRRMDEMTSREIEFYLQAGGDLVCIPFGPLSGHGAFIPIGIHGHWAQALSVLLAQKANGLVYPPLFCCYAGGTRTFRGTVSFPIRQQAEILKFVAQTLRPQGFRRIVLVGGTTPENTGAYVAARELFDETEHPFWYVNASLLLDTPEVKALLEGYPAAAGETLIGLASLKILGRERPLPMPKWIREDKKDNDPDLPAEIHKEVSSLRRWGAVGFRYYAERNHGNHGIAGNEYKGKPDVDFTVEVLQKCAEVLAPYLENYSRYCDWLERQPVAYIKPTERLDESLI